MEVGGTLGNEGSQSCSENSTCHSFWPFGAGQARALECVGVSKTELGTARGRKGENRNTSKRDDCSKFQNHDYSIA